MLQTVYTGVVVLTLLALAGAAIVSAVRLGWRTAARPLVRRRAGGRQG